ncbi:MAG: flagellar motor protein MotB [Candidatus Marinimicrobia bacterium]|jgi:chemotaxis protein MotB|nr:flagellar motor protein MotB [Candidatus Neomarinimicrobiota bacterium]|tara:strand:- start:91 stop:777 length:687 start_codon:yes stop_codon:yes gene_type:complete
MQQYNFPLDIKRKNTWLISYGDLITLLITFFIMMISVESGRISQVHKWINQQLTFSTEEFKEYITDKNISGINVQQDTKGIHITIQSKGMFKEGDAVPNRELISQLTHIANVIDSLNIISLDKIPSYKEDLMFFRKKGLDWVVKILVEGHTDNIRIIPGSRYKNNWELSAARAQTVMRALQEQIDLPSEYFAIKGYSEFKPIVDNNSIQNRFINRRVDIIVNASLLKM